MVLTGLLQLLLAIGVLASSMPFQSCTIQETLLGASCHTEQAESPIVLHDSSNAPTCPPHDHPCVCKQSRNTSTGSTLKQFSPRVHEPAPFAADCLMTFIEARSTPSVLPAIHPPPQSLPLLI
jgi:hypothetical protein